MWSARNSEGYESPVAITTEATILTVVDDGLSVLLVRRASEPFSGAWGLPGGFLGSTESPSDCARRKLEEKTGIEAAYLEQLATYVDVDGDPRGWIPSIAYLALMPWQAPVADEAAWYPVDDLPPLVLDHARIVADAVARLRGKLWYSNVAMGLLPDRFPLSHARRVYETISGIEYDVANFRRDLLGSGLVVPTSEVQHMQRGRPALLYRFSSAVPTWIPPKGC